MRPAAPVLRRPLWAALLTVAAVSFVFRLGPLDSKPIGDEQYVVDNMENFYRTKSLAPSHFINPPLSHYICWVFQTASLGASSAKPFYETYARHYFIDQAPIYRLCRFVHYALGALVAVVAAAFAWRLYGSIPIALLAGLFTALSYAHGFRSRLALSDVPLSLFFTAAAGFLLLFLKENRRGFLYAGAFLGGMAMAVKLSGLLLIFPVLALVFVRARDKELSKRGAIFLCGALAAVAAAVALFDLGGLWKPLMTRFSDDGAVDTESLYYFQRIVRRLTLLSGAAFIASLHPFVRRRAWATLTDRSLYAAGGLFVLGFFILNPYWLIYFKTFAAYFFLTVIHVQMTGHLGMEGKDWVWYFPQFWREDRLLALLLAAGLLLALWREKGTARWAAAFAVFCFLYIGGWAEKATRFMIPMLPLAGLAASVALWRAAERKRWGKTVLIAWLIAAGAWQAHTAWTGARREARPDARDAARDWIERNIPAGQRIVYDNYVPALHSLETLSGLQKQGLITVERAYRSASLYDLRKIDEYALDPAPWGPRDWVILSSLAYERFFDEGQRPPADSPLRAVFDKRRAFYDAVLNGRAALEPIAQFGGGPDTAGPKLHLFQARRD